MRSSPMCFGLRMSSRDAPPTPKHANQAAGRSKESTEYINPGLRLWNESREKWVADKKIATRSQLLNVLKLRSICMDTKLHLCSVTTCKDMHRLLNSAEPFPRPVPLGEMVDFLVNVWDDEGMYEMI